MKNCHDDMLAFHNERVTLSGGERTEMRGCRDANRNRLKKGLERDKEPAPQLLKSQGSYSMWTMVQYLGKDYDIDDGIYFSRDALKGPQGGDKTPAAAKEMIRKAVHDSSFKTEPAIRTNCVRVYYDAGYHVDLPVYRITETENLFGEITESYELASTVWKSSEPSKVTEWFKAENQSQSPDQKNGGQLRRITRLLKTFSRSRDSWKSRIASGFIITKLVAERYSSDENREDAALFDTMEAIRNRLNQSLEVDHPVLNERLTKGPDDASTRFLRDKLTESLSTLEITLDDECSTKDARKAWDKVFNSDFFSSRPSDDDEDSGGGGKGTKAAVLIKSGEDRTVRKAVDKRGGGTYAKSLRT